MNQAGPIEAALTTDLRGEPYNFALWDIHTGTQLVVFKGNKSSPNPRCLQLIDNNYFVTVCDNVLQVWSIFNRKSQEQKLFLPSRPTALCSSPCGNYLVAGIAEMIYIWQWHSGNLVAHTQKHFQTISVLKLTSCGFFLISAGEDGLVLVWSFADLISGTNHTNSLNIKRSGAETGTNEPRYTWQHHSGPVTDIHTTSGGLCATSSIDTSVNLYCYRSGARLFSVSFASPIWSIVIDKNETSIFAGSQEGSIYEIPISSISISRLISPTEPGGASKKAIFVGHKGRVNFLSLSTDGTRLISGSLDSSCKVWDVRQRKMLHMVRHQAAIANLTTLLVPKNLALTSMAQIQQKPPLSTKPLKRTLYKVPRDRVVTSEDMFEEASSAIVYIRNDCDLWRSDISESYDDGQVILTNGVHTVENTSKNDEYETLKAKFKALYKLSAERIFKDSAENILKSFNL